MAYRRSDEMHAFTSRWRLEHHSELSDCGIPQDTTATDQRWRYALLHGEDPESGWEESWLSDEQASRLLALLGTVCPEPVGIELIERAQRRFK